MQNHVVQDNHDDNHDEDDDNTDEDNSLTSNTDVSYGCWDIAKVMKSCQKVSSQEASEWFTSAVSKAETRKSVGIMVAHVHIIPTNNTLDF